MFVCKIILLKRTEAKLRCRRTKQTATALRNSIDLHRIIMSRVPVFCAPTDIEDFLPQHSVRRVLLNTQTRFRSWRRCRFCFDDICAYFDTSNSQASSARNGSSSSWVLSIFVLTVSNDRSDVAPLAGPTSPGTSRAWHASFNRCRTISHQSLDTKSPVDSFIRSSQTRDG